MRRFADVCMSFYAEFLILSASFFVILVVSFLLFPALYVSIYTKDLWNLYGGFENIHDKVVYHDPEF